MGLAASSTFTSELPIQFASRPAGDAIAATEPEPQVQSGPLTLRPTAADAEFDSSLMALISNGNCPAMAALYDRHCTLVYSIARRMLEPSLADECIHEVFMALWRTPGEFMKSRRGLEGALAIQTFERAKALRIASLPITVAETLTP